MEKIRALEIKAQEMYNSAIITSVLRKKYAKYACKVSSAVRLCQQQEPAEITTQEQVLV